MLIKEIFKKVLIWRLITVIFAIPGILFLSLKPGYTQLKPGFSFDNFINMWANFDGFHYLNLAKYWYGSPFTYLNYAFFPVYPWIIRVFNILGNYIYSGLLISHLSFIFALFFLWKLIRLDYSVKVANTTLVLLLIFPTSFFFGSVYTESLFLLISVLSFFFIRKKMYFLACVFAAIASATRVTGIFIWPAILYEFWVINGKNIKKFLTPYLLWFSLPPLGLLSYMNFQFTKTNDALFFVHSQPLFGANREVDKFIMIYQVLYRYAKMLIFVDHTNPLFFTVLLEFLVGTAFLVLVLYAFKKLRMSYSIYAFLSYLLPTLSGTFSSMPRYVLVLFPIFILMAEIYLKLPKKLQYLYLSINIVFSIFAITFFTRGYFVG
jgi:Gpi18-like mannosyltransferase